ncbi:blue copper protein-like [Zingiber officinale]|uniref:blue copper protein-like n=1 Tax=Zingiber officinale TaxID=94328 RepID=UPI001C4AFF25|nr:blue copper protein-like [Zingiber officinale]
MAIALCVILFFSGTVLSVTATDYTVGDSSGWANGVDYLTWTSGKTFTVGDTLVFNYGSGMHTVDRVSSSDYSACSSGNALSTDNSGQTTVPLSSAGDYYFICGVAGHCANGMKLTVAVASPSSTTTSPPTGTTTTPTPTINTPTGTTPYSAAGRLSPASLSLLMVGLMLAVKLVVAV